MTMRFEGKVAMVTATVNLEELNKVNVLTERVKKRKQEFLAAKPHLCPQRSRLFVESWKETEGEPLVIRWAKAFQNILEGVPIVIRDGELVVGSQNRYVRGCFCAPEFHADGFIGQLSAEKLTSSGEMVECDIEEWERKSILEDAYYWKGKSFACKATREWEELWGSKIADFEKARAWSSFIGNVSEVSAVDYEKVLKKGLIGVADEAREQINKAVIVTEEDLHKIHFWRAVVIVCEAGINYARRHADLAREMARAETDVARRKELETIAEICDWVPANPARSFHEALQSFWFIHLELYLETTGLSKAPGRFDQYMFPFYEKDIREGRLTRQEAAELLGLLWVKIGEYEPFKPGDSKKYFANTTLQNVTIGGVKRDGSDATNELSYLMLEVAGKVKGNNPHLSLRYHDNIPGEFLIKAAETNIATGAGIPAFFNDGASIPSLMETWGTTLEEARDFALVGCGEKQPAPYAAVSSKSGLSLAKPFELTLYNGIDSRTGIQLGPATGDARNFTSFEELSDAFKKQYAYMLDSLIPAQKVAQIVLTNTQQLPFHSALLNDCIEKGADQLGWGCHWRWNYDTIVLFGIQNPVNSLAAIKKLVFEDKRVTMAELLDALAVNFEGKDDLRQLLLAAPKWGNDDDYVDEIMKDVWRWTGEITAQHPAMWESGGYHIAKHGVSFNYYFGQVTGALPDGRKAWEPLADGSLSPMRGTDVKGPTAVINSASKIDISRTESTVLNQKIHPSVVQTREGIEKFLSLIKTYFNQGGYHIQFNIVSRETLLDAQRHPENYRDLLVRVAGYSAFFVELPRDIQDDIIARTEQTF